MSSTKRPRTVNHKNTQQQQQPQQTQNTSLPPELWIRIAKLLPADDLIALRRTNNLIGNCAQEVYNKKLSIAKIAENNRTFKSLQLLFSQALKYVREGDEFALLMLVRNAPHTMRTLAGVSIVRVYDDIYKYQRDRAISLIMAFCGGKMQSGSKTMLHVAAARGHVAVANALIVGYGVSVDIEDSNGFTPLSYAIKHGKNDVVDLLVTTHKANVNARRKKAIHATPLHVAILTSQCSRNERIDIIHILINNKADVNVANKKGKTPLHLAMNTVCCHIWYLVTRQLNADFYLKDEQHNTPLDYARQTIQTCKIRKKAAVLNLVLEEVLFRQPR